MIKNLSQFKKAMSEGKSFKILEHGNFPEYVGQIRKPNKVQTNGMYTILPNDPNGKLSTCNYGKGLWFPYGKAEQWEFVDGVIKTFSPKSGPHNGRLIWTIQIIEEGE